MESIRVQLFHASKLDFLDGQVIVASEPTTFYPDAVAALEKSKPIGAPSRSICFFSSNSAEFAVYFLHHQDVPLADIRLYEVEMPFRWKSPMALVHTLQRRLEKSEYTKNVIDEYWISSNQWHFYEFFGPEMVIKKRISIPALNEIALFIDYSGETSRASQL